MLMVKNRRMHSHQNPENATNESTSSSNTVPVVVSVSTTAGNTITNSIPPHVRNKEHSLVSHIPGYVTKIEETKAGGRYLCTPCQSHCNSDIQLSQHLSSRKHMEKLSRKMNSTNGIMGEMCHVVDISNRPIHQGNIFCHVCKLSFSSQSVMDTHLSGSKHQRKLKSIELIKSLEGTEPSFKYDALTGDIVCTLCDVVFYSPQHIKRHIEGEKHKGKRENGEEGGTPAKKHCTANLGHSVNDNEHSSAGFEAPEGNAITTITSSSMTSAPHPRKDQALLNMNVPSCVSKVEDSKTGGKFLCNPCQAHCNSDIQLSQHLSSKKHLDKMVLYCDVCYIPFTSEVLLDSHLMGAKHKRKLKWRELLKNLQATEPSFSFDLSSGEVQCSLCSVFLYSPQHILNHIEGEKHVKHLSGLKDGGEESTLSLKLLLSATLEQNGSEGSRSGGSSSGEGNTPPTNATSISTATTTALTLSSMLHTKEERPTLKMAIPAYVTKVDDEKTGGKYLCTPCHVQCNSDMQLSQHLTSKKHADKLSGRKRSPTGMRGNWRGGRGGGSMGRGRGGTSCRGGGVMQRMDLMAPNSAFHSNNNVGAYPHASFPDQNISNYGTGDSYGLSSLGRGAVSEYGGFGRPGVGGRGGRGCAVGRNDSCGRVEGDYGRGAPSVYARQDNHSRWSDYGAGRAEELNYGRPTAEYAPRAYGSGQNVGHMSGRGIPFTYTQPLSQNFVSGGTIL